MSGAVTTEIAEASFALHDVADRDARNREDGP
jgi:hypothetical protein